MKFKFLSQPEHYDGSQLVSLRNYLTHGVLGDSVVAWIGSCDVSFEHMVDGEDLIAQAEIAAAKMLHFIVEKFDVSLFAAVVLQRLFASTAKDVLKQLSPQHLLRREGDDLFLGQRKLSISIATQSPVSSLIHFAVNISNAGTPVETCSLEDLGVDPQAFAEELMRHFCLEVESMITATHKVRGVK